MDPRLGLDIVDGNGDKRAELQRDRPIHFAFQNAAQLQEFINTLSGVSTSGARWEFRARIVGNTLDYDLAEIDWRHEPIGSGLVVARQ